MRRRDFISLLGGAAASTPLWPLAARAQPLPLIGYFLNGIAEGYTAQTNAFRRGLQETGFRENENLTIAYRWTDNKLDRIPAMMAELIQARPSVLVTNGGTVRAAKAATATIPIVFVGGGDPVQAGLVASFNRPGGNMTGIVQFGGALGAKRLELLQQFVPNVATVILLTNPEGPTAQRAAADVQAAAQKLGLPVRSLTARTEQEMRAAFMDLGSGSGRVLVVGADPFFLSRRDLLVSLAARNQIPAIYDFRDYTESGGLMSYGASLTDAYRQLGVYAGRVLKGEKPADLPILQPTKFEFVINLRAAKALGLAVPDRTLALADEVIE